MPDARCLNLDACLTPPNPKPKSEEEIAKVRNSSNLADGVFLPARRAPPVVAMDRPHPPQGARRTPVLPLRLPLRSGHVRALRGAPLPRV